MFSSVFKKVFGSANDRFVKRLHSTIDKINSMHLAQAEGEMAHIVFLQSNTNQEGSPKVLTTSTTCIIERVTMISDIEGLQKAHIEGTILKPSTWAVA